ncbi:MAG TPA: dTDP-4-dehydrorhamnose reductase [Gemmataceae bacterium]|nr:dTDP-4-dehydrorhamnose reductase [Gemmataceae bacterium]
MRYAVLGAAGQLGRDLCPRLPGEVIPLSRNGSPAVDLSRPESLLALFDNTRPDVVINCAAYNFVDRAESEPQEAFAVNAWGVRELARLCRERDCLLVHFSTDYVFGLDAARRQPWTESDAPGPVSVYGLSKLAGEYLVRMSCPRHLVIRTCGLYGVWGSGGKGGNFVETMLRLSSQGKPLRVVNDQTCTPSYTVDVAETTIALLNAGQLGLYHVTNSGSCTWYELTRTIFELSGVQASLTPIPSSEYPTPARRPTYSVLDHAALRALGISSPRPWREALAAYLRERQQKS